MVDLTGCKEEYRKACDKYRVTKPDAGVVKRRWRIFLSIEAVLLACAVLLFDLPRWRRFTQVPTAGRRRARGHALCRANRFPGPAPGEPGRATLRHCGA